MAFLVIGALFAIGLPPVQGEPSARRYAVIASTALAMGVRSATMRRLGAVLNTTLVTGTLVTWIRHSDLGGGTGAPGQGYRVAGPAAVWAGAAIGTLLLRVGITAALLVAAAGVLGAMGGIRGLPRTPRPVRRPGAVLPTRRRRPRRSPAPSWPSPHRAPALPSRRTTPEISSVRAATRSGVARDLSTDELTAKRCPGSGRPGTATATQRTPSLVSWSSTA
ncbi:DUF1275 family protein [Streptomyces sp. NPDC014861]|uniref:DUF1275 family protein n=1 Tax=Streptomyces sp. NPDC014861 TaxID=3364923 RepID=UPI0036FA256E